MSYSYDLNSINLSDDTMDTITISANALGTSGSSIAGTGLYWGMNGTSANPSLGQVYTTNGTSSGWGNISLAEPALNGATLKVNGNADFEGEVTIKGKSLTDMIDKIEERLAILHPNPELEDRWDELKELGKRYKELEQEIIEKEKVWNILKK